MKFFPGALRTYYEYLFIAKTIRPFFFLIFLDKYDFAETNLFGLRKFKCTSESSIPILEAHSPKICNKSILNYADPHFHVPVRGIHATANEIDFAINSLQANTNKKRSGMKCSGCKYNGTSTRYLGPPHSAFSIILRLQYYCNTREQKTIVC